jgi:hypothetical protein
MCPHTPPCPAASDPDHEAARTLISHPEQGWSLLCNGIVVFEDTGELLPGGTVIAPHRPTDIAMTCPVVHGPVGASTIATAAVAGTALTSVPASPAA